MSPVRTDPESESIRSATLRALRAGRPGAASRARRQSWLRALQQADARRPDLPGEQAAVLGLGVLLLLGAGHSRSLAGRLLVAAAGGALIARAATRQGGLERLARQASAWLDRI